MKKRLLSLLCVVGLAACTVTLIGDVQVYVTINGSTASSSCSQYGVATWDILLDGPERMRTSIPCGSQWSALVSVEEGLYSVTVTALSSASATLAQKTVPSVRVSGTAASATFNFAESDFTGAGGPTIDIYWNVNGTVDGTDKGPSWDTCSEVGAKWVVLTIDGTTQQFDCYNGGNMSAAVSVSEGSHTLTAKLTDASNADITTTTTQATISATAAQKGLFIADFYWDSFLTIRDTTYGDYWFATSFEGGKSCSEVSPVPSYQVSLLKLNGTAVNPAPQVCGPDSSCYDATGADFGKCWGPTDTQKIKNVLWGNYKLKIQGTLDSPQYKVCWESKDPTTSSNEVDILIGAGATNPLMAHDLPRVAGVTCP